MLSFYVIYLRFSAEQNTIAHLKHAIKSNENIIFWLIVVSLFSIGNWYFEIIKWKKFVEFLSPITFSQSAKQSLGAQTVAMFTPNRLGEYGAKAVFFNKTERPAVFKLTFFHHLHQLLITIILGLSGFLLLGYNQYFLAISAVFILGLLMLFFLKNVTVKGFSLVNLKDFYCSLPKKSRFQNIIFSLIRYIIFAHQYYFFLLIFGLQLDYATAISIICCMYVLSSILPMLTLLDVVVKSGVALFLFSRFDVNSTAILLVSFLMWLCNQALPALLGNWFVIKFSAKTLQA